LNGAEDTTDTLLGTRDVPALGPGASSSANTPLTIPATTVAAKYYVLAKADGPAVLIESAEYNNVRSSAITIGADLVVSAMTAPANGGAGVQISVSDTTKNQGTGASAPSTTRFYLSPDLSLDPDDVMLAARPVPGLIPGASNTATTTLIIPSNTLTGTYRVIAAADADDQVEEASDTNNTRSASIRVGPDLSVSALTVPARAAVGGSISIADTTTNIGAGGAGAASRTAFYLSTNTAWDAGDIPLNVYREVAALAAGGVSSGSTLVALPGAAGPGRWYVIARADDLSQVAETLETNNTKYDAIDIGPDLAVTSVTSASTVVAGTSLNVTDTVRNYGIDTAPASTNRYYLSLNTVLDAGDIPLNGQRNVPAVIYNGSNTGSASVLIPTGVSGSYYLLVIADGDGLIPESSETNNDKARFLTITK
jgi:subtilase family serine protease